MVNPLLKADVWLFEAVGGAPQAEKSLDIGIEGGLAEIVGFCWGAVIVAGVGSGAAQASLEPQASILEKDELVFAVGCGGAGADFPAGLGAGAGVERLKTEFDLGGGRGVEVTGAGACTGGDGSEKSKRPFEKLAVAVFDAGGAGLEGELKEPKSSDNKESTCGAGRTGGFEEADCFGMNLDF